MNRMQLRMEGITAPPLTSAEPGRLVQVKVRNGFLSTHSDSTETGAYKCSQLAACFCLDIFKSLTCQ